MFCVLTYKKENWLLYPHLCSPMEGLLDSSQCTTSTGVAPSGDLSAPSKQHSLSPQGLQPFRPDPTSPSNLARVCYIDQKIACSLSMWCLSHVQPPSPPSCYQKITDSLPTMLLSYEFDCRSLASTPTHCIVTTDNPALGMPHVPPLFIQPLVINIDCCPPMCVYRTLPQLKRYLTIY